MKSMQAGLLVALVSMVVSGEKSDTLSTYAIDPASGALTRIGQYPAGKGANWVEIVAFD